VEDNKFGVPAGWYPDPLGLPQLRWWDSQAWTEHTSEARAPIVIQPATRLAFADDEELPSRREQRERERERQQQSKPFAEPFEDEPLPHRFDTQTDTVDDELSAQPLLAMTLRELEPPPAGAVDEFSPGPKRASAHTNAAPVASTLSALAEELAPEREIKQRRTYTGAVWVFAVMPLIQTVASAILILSGLGHNFPLFVVVALVPFLFMLGLAAYDRLVLQTWGYEKPASAWWALLWQPGYLVARGLRTFRENGKGFAPLIGYASTLMGVLVGVIVLPGILISAAPTVFTEEIEASVTADAAAFGAELTVECPRAPLLIDETVTCVGSKANGETDSILVSLQRENGWISWRVEDWGSWVMAG
jgi:hypothetical protein